MLVTIARRFYPMFTGRSPAGDMPAAMRFVSSWLWRLIGHCWIMRYIRDMHIIIAAIVVGNMRFSRVVQGGRLHGIRIQAAVGIIDACYITVGHFHTLIAGVYFPRYGIYIIDRSRVYAIADSAGSARSRRVYFVRGRGRTILSAG